MAPGMNMYGQQSYMSPGGYMGQGQFGQPGYPGMRVPGQPGYPGQPGMPGQPGVPPQDMQPQFNFRTTVRCFMEIAAIIQGFSLILMILGWVGE